MIFLVAVRMCVEKVLYLSIYPIFWTNALLFHNLGATSVVRISVVIWKTTSYMGGRSHYSSK